jgi:hypothetical protein
MSIGRCLALLLSLFMSSAAVSLAQEPPPRPFLRKVIGLTDAQLAAMDKGEVVTKLLPSPDKPEIAAFGVVRITGTPATLQQKLADFPSFRKVPQIPQIGHFSNPPRVEDLSGLTWPEADVEALKRCKLGSCDVKLGTASLERLAEVDWKAPDAMARVTALIKEQMVAFVNAYRTGGTDAMAATVDKSQPKALADEFRTLLRNSPYLPEYVPAFHQYLAAYPKGSLPNSADAMFWTKDEFGLKPVVSMYHATVHQVDVQGRPGLLVAIKTLYASHFFNAGLEIMAAVPTQDGTGFYLLDLYRTRIDPPTGMLSGVLMGKVKSGVEKGVGMNLTTAKGRVEGK